MKYPNLTEVYKYHPYSDATFAEHAKITIKLLHEVLAGDEALTFSEMYHISRLIEMPVDALYCSKLITLSKDNYNHQKMIDKVKNALETMRTYRKMGNEQIIRCLDRDGCDLRCEYLISKFNDNTATYGHYIGVLGHINTFIIEVNYYNDESQRRDIKKSLW